MGSGKTALATYFVQRYGYRRLSFATAVRRVLYALSPEMADAPKAEQRAWLQKVGDGLRAVDENIWVTLLLKDLAALAPGTPWVVDDCRRLNEWYALVDQGAVPIALDCPVEIRRQRIMARDGAWDPNTVYHASEVQARDLVERMPTEGLIFFDDASPDLSHLDAEAQQEAIFRYWDEHDTMDYVRNFVEDN